jgi:hypothetical protein
MWIDFFYFTAEGAEGAEEGAERDFMKFVLAVIFIV